MSLRPAHLRGGPLDGHNGEVVTPSPDVLPIGPTGGFIYRLQGLKDGVLQYRYDAKASRRALVAAGVAPDLAAFAVDDVHTAQQLLNGQAPATPDDGVAITVDVRRYADRWELWASLEGGQPMLLEQLPREAFPDDDTDTLKEWVEASTHALAQEAMNR